MKHSKNELSAIELAQLEAQRVVWWKSAEIAKADGHAALADWFDNRAEIHSHILTNADLVFKHPMNVLKAGEGGEK